ncbi:Uncharacterized protein APZ42_008369 [Daphnia magna]|uniref:Uncharacterized protein n=1 Tax=Daphnia magna TaxID=35525 RepID=A0A164EP87_9CRUS|nr:Uncharacterized protein APZ42_008369 [Daphnia magna]
MSGCPSFLRGPGGYSSSSFLHSYRMGGWPSFICNGTDGSVDFVILVEIPKKFPELSSATQFLFAA